MKFLDLQNEFRELVAQFRNEIDAASAMGQFDAHKVAENVMCGLLRELCGWPTLRNLNTEQANFPGIDLADDTNRVAIQVAHSMADLMLFGEWCAARHSLGYDHLPDWFLLFDVYDRSQGRFWSTPRRNALATALGLATAPRLLEGRCTLPQLKDVLSRQHSQFRQGMLEGVVIRRESAEWCEARAKLVRPDFTQAIGEHWSRRRIEWNRLGRKQNEFQGE